MTQSNTAAAGALLPNASIDFNKLHDNAAAGAKGSALYAGAIIGAPEPAQPPAPEPAADEAPADPQPSAPKRGAKA